MNPPLRQEAFSDVPSNSVEFPKAPEIIRFWGFFFSRPSHPVAAQSDYRMGVRKGVSCGEPTAQAVGGQGQQADRAGPIPGRRRTLFPDQQVRLTVVDLSVHARRPHTGNGAGRPIGPIAGRPPGKKPNDAAPSPRTGSTPLSSAGPVVSRSWPGRSAYSKRLPRTTSTRTSRPGKMPSTPTSGAIPRPPTFIR